MHWLKSLRSRLFGAPLSRRQVKRPRRSVRLRLQRLEDRLVPAVQLTYGGPATALLLKELKAGATPTVLVSETTAGTLQIDLGAGHTFAATSTMAATGLTYQNAGSPSTSEFATVDISTASDISALQVALLGDTLNLGPISDAAGGLGSITASAAAITVNGVNTAASNGNVNLAASKGLTVASNSVLYTGLGLISLAADVSATGKGDSDTTDALSILSGAVVTSSNTGTSAITLRGAAVNIDTSSDPARVGSGTSGLSTTPTVTLTGLGDPQALTFDSNGNLFVANARGSTVCEFVPGATTPTATLTGLAGAQDLAFDGSGDLFVPNYQNNTVSEFTPGSTTPSATLTGLDWPQWDVFDGSGNLYVSNLSANTVSEFAPGSTTPTATLTGLNEPENLVFDGSGDLFVANYGNDTVSEFAPGATSPTTTLTGASNPYDLAFDSGGNLFVANYGNGTASEFAPGSVTPTATLTVGANPFALRFDRTGNLFVANSGDGTVSEFAPGTTSPSTTLTGLSDPSGLAFDSNGNLFVTNQNSGTVSEFANNANTFGAPAGGVVIRAALPTETMSIGGNASGANVNLTSAELSQIFTTATGTITFGDSSQTGTIAFQNAVLGTTTGASVVVQQSPTGAGQIVLNGSSGTALSAGSGNVTLNAGKHGIADAGADIAGTGVLTINTTGAIGSASAPLVVDGTSTPSKVVIGSKLKPASVYLEGQGNYTLGTITSVGAQNFASLDGSIRVAGKLTTANSNITFASPVILGGTFSVAVGTGTVDMLSTSSLAVQINGTTTSKYTELNVSGAVNLDADSGLGALLEVAIGYASKIGDTYTLIKTTAGVLGTFDGLPEGATITVGGKVYRISYAANGGKNVTLTRVS